MRWMCGALERGLLRAYLVAALCWLVWHMWNRSSLKPCVKTYLPVLDIATGGVGGGRQEDLERGDTVLFLFIQRPAKGREARYY